MPARPLTLHEREEIRAGIERRDADHVIAAVLGRHRCTINAEVRRNGGRSCYRATDAQRRAESALSRPKVPKLVADRALAGHVARRLKAKDSPMTISIELARGVHGRVAKISHECIYQAVYSPGGVAWAPVCTRGCISNAAAANIVVEALWCLRIRWDRST